MSVPSFPNALLEYYVSESARIREAFDLHRDGRAAVRERTAVVDSLCLQLWQRLVSPLEQAPGAFSLAAIGGFGRRALFPSSDVDLLFLFGDEATEQQWRDVIRRFCQELWDLRLRVSPATRLLAECARLDYENVEFTISLLDCRYLAGAPGLFAGLRQEMLPRLIVRERQPLVQRLAELSQERHRKFGNTIFHLEPNVKEGPGGLRDYNLATWLTLIATLDKPRVPHHPEAHFPAPLRDESSRALDFLYCVRCFLHYRAGRDDNLLSWEAQDEAADAGIGLTGNTAADGSGWMRHYFRHARSLSRLAANLLDEVPSARSSLYQSYQQWRSRLSTADFSVAQGRIYLQQPSALNADLILHLFEFMARHGLKLSAETELRVSQVLPSLGAQPPAGPELWPRLRQILTLPHAAAALRSMHALGLLTLLLPELHGIDTLVIRDFYHRYTVDEHSIIAIESLHALRHPQNEFEQPFATLFQEIQRPDLLMLAMLLHDVGKGQPRGGHVEAGMPLVVSALTRLQLAADECETVSFLIEQHLQISMSLLRRDIFDPGTARTLAELMESTERLKMLCLVTYADIRAVNPDALKAWKAEDIWHLYMQTANYLDRTVDDRRLHVEGADELVVRHLKDLSGERRAQVAQFAEGLPRRYLLTHSTSAIVGHAELAAALSKFPVQLALTIGSDFHRLTVVTGDRPGLFATVSGVLAAWGMDIIKADAFSNQAGVILDTFTFVDAFHTLELNPPERERFKRSLTDVLLGEVPLQRLLEARRRGRKAKPRSAQPPLITIDNHASGHSTIFEVVCGDRNGLLYSLASVFSDQGCNIDVALIDTQGPLAIDVFYVTAGGSKLSLEQQQEVRQTLLEELTE